MKSRGHELFGTLDAVEVVADPPEGVRHGLAEGSEELGLLEHRVGLTAGKGVAGEQEQGDPVCRRAACRRDHVHGSGADGRHAGDDLRPVFLLGERGSRQSHVLFVLALQEADAVTALLKSLTDADDASVPEDAEHIVDESGLPPVQFHVLGVEEADQRLRHRQTNGFHSINLLEIPDGKGDPGKLRPGRPSTCFPAPSPRDVL